MWQKLIAKLKTKLEKFKYKTSTIFGLSVIVNSNIIPKLIYTCNITFPDENILKQINVLIRNFVFRHTVHSIKQKTLIQDKLIRGMSLQDIKTKIEALRIKFVVEIIKQPQNYPLAHYYIGTYISNLCKPNNAVPHFIGVLPTFYKQCIDALKGHEQLIHNKTTDIYKQLVLDQALPLQRRIKVGYKYFITDHSSIFRNLHCNQLSTKAREVTYRLIFNITPVTQPSHTD
jgi:hypothetical protein